MSQAPDLRNNADGGRSDEELLRVTEDQYDSLSDSEMDRLIDLQANSGETAGSTGAKNDATEEASEGSESGEGEKEKEKDEDAEGETGSDVKEEEEEEEGEETPLEKLLKSDVDSEDEVASGSSGPEKGKELEFIMKKKGWLDPEVAKNQVAKSYWEVEKRMRALERDKAELTKKLENSVEKQQLETLVTEKAKQIIGDSGKQNISQEEIKSKLAENSAKIYEALNNPDTAGEVLRDVISLAVRKAKEEAKVEFDAVLKPLKESEELRQAEAMKSAVEQEYLATIDMIQKQITGGDRAKAELVFEKIRPQVEKGYDEVGEKYQEKPGSLKLVVSKVILENGLFPQTKSVSKSRIDTGDGKKRGIQSTKGKLTSEKLESMTEEQIAKLSDKEIEEAIRLENQGKRSL